MQANSELTYYRPDDHIHEMNFGERVYIQPDLLEQGIVENPQTIRNEYDAY